MGRAPRRAGQGARGCGPRAGERLSKRRVSATRRRCRRRPMRSVRRVRRARRAVHAVRPGDRRGDGRRRACACVAVERVWQLGRGGRDAALLRRPLGCAAGSDRRDADPDGSDPEVRDPRRTRSGVRPETPRHSVCDRTKMEYYGFELETERESVDVAPPPDEAARLKREYAGRKESGRTSRGRGKRRRDHQPPRGSRGPGSARGRGGQGPRKRRGH